MVAPPPNRPVSGPVLRAWRAAVVLLCHTGLAALVVICIKALEWLLHLLWGTGEALLFDRFPLRYLFDAMDGGVILVFVWFGIVEAVRAFRS
jgi:hypothetical protein